MAAPKKPPYVKPQEVHRGGAGATVSVRFKSPKQSKSPQKVHRQPKSTTGTGKKELGADGVWRYAPKGTSTPKKSIKIKGSSGQTYYKAGK